ncbi:unnamed protein product [Boreogadus saida]
MEPDITWVTYNDVRQLITCQTYEEARRGEHKYTSTMCATTEIESEEEKGREKIKTKQNPLYMDSDSDEPSGEPKKPRLSRPPDVRVPAAWSSQLARNETMAASTSSTGLYHQLQVPQREGTSTPPYGSVHTPFRTPQYAQNDVTMQGDNGQLLKDLAIQKMTKMLAEVLVVVNELSRDVQFIKGELAEARMTPSCGPGPATSQEMFPIQLPITNEEDFNEAETLLGTEPVRQKMIARLALVGGTSSTCMIRRMLATVLTNGLACKFNWAGKTCTQRDAKQPFKDTALQDCMFVASRQCDRKLTAGLQRHCEKLATLRPLACRRHQEKVDVAYFEQQCDTAALSEDLNPEPPLTKVSPVALSSLVGTAEGDITDPS